MNQCNYMPNSYIDPNLKIPENSEWSTPEFYTVSLKTTLQHFTTQLISFTIVLVLFCIYIIFLSKFGLWPLYLSLLAIISYWAFVLVTFVQSKTKYTEIVQHECEECRRSPYSKGCLKTWWKQAGCTNDNYIKNYPSNGAFHELSPDLLKAYMAKMSITDPKACLSNTEYELLPDNRYIPKNSI